MNVETRTVSETSEYAIYFHETPGLSISRHWAPDVKAGQRLELTLDYDANVLGKIVSVRVLEGNG